MIIHSQNIQIDKSNFMAIADSQIFIALFIALITGILAVRLGIELYK
jgi:photosystem I reaction center subunit XII